MKTPLTKKKLREHIRYHGWKYVLLVVLAVFGWDLLLTATAYHPGPEKIVDLYAYGNVDTDAMQLYMVSVLKNEMTDMEQMNAVVITDDDTYGDYILSTRIAASEGDVYVLPRERFEAFAAEGILAPLEDETELLSTLGSANLERGYWYKKSRDDSGKNERHLYGIPLSAIPGADQLIYGYADPSNTFLCVLVSNGNHENVIRFLTIFVNDANNGHILIPERNTQQE